MGGASRLDQIFFQNLALIRRKSANEVFSAVNAPNLDGTRQPPLIVGIRLFMFL